jgi:adenine-specific DNA-methyltransferase
VWVRIYMAKIEDLIAQIPDERLRKGIAAEVKALKKTKQFGLVFEEHLPESAWLPRLPIKGGELVALKREGGNRLWRVMEMEDDVAICDRAIEGYPSSQEAHHRFPVSDLVVVRNFGDPIYPALVPIDRVEGGEPDKPWHVLINADNFHALQVLLYCYESKVDVIYIDPPYNSGARDWKYNNDYVDQSDSYRHSKRLSMMKKRLLLAKRLLKPDGVLMVTVDENEVFHLVSRALGQCTARAERKCTSSEVPILGDLPAVEASVKAVGLHEVEIDGWRLAEAGGGVGSSPEVPGMRSRA